MNMAALRVGAQGSVADQTSLETERRSDTRVTLVLRPAKLISNACEIGCIVRDISASGFRARLFHPLPEGDDYRVQFNDSDIHRVELVRSDGEDVAFQFISNFDVVGLVAGPSPRRHRPLRLRMKAEIEVSANGETLPATLMNLSQKGAMLTSESHFALGQLLFLRIPTLQPIGAKVCWRDTDKYGLVLEETFNFQELARHGAALQGLSRSPQ